MFRIIGGDDKQYGPATIEEVQEWIRIGRAGAQTRAQREGETDWRTLSSFAEFADAFAGATGGAGPGEAGNFGLGPPAWTRPLAGPIDPDRLMAEALARGGGVDIGGTLRRAWDLMVADFWPIVGVTALIALLLGVANGAYVGVVLTGPMLGGLCWYLLKKIRSQPAQIADSFIGFSGAFLPLFLGFLVSALLVSVGLLLCIVPGIYLAVAWQFTLLLILDRKLEFWPAMEVSRKVISANWWAFLGFAVVTWLLNLAGTLCCVVGAFVTMPWTLLALIYLYEDRFGPALTLPAASPTAPAGQPTAPPT